MSRKKPSETKLLICTWHRFTLWQPPASLAERVRAAYPQMRVVHLPTFAGLDQEVEDTNILVGFSLKPEQFARARQLQWIHSTAAGVWQLMFPELRKSSVQVTNARGVHSIPMAEHIVGMLLAVAKKFPSAVLHQAQRHWGQQEIWDNPPPPRELHGQTLLFIGFGEIAKETARRLASFGMRILAVTRSGSGDRALAQEIFPAVQLEKALPQADYVVVSAPETSETHHLIGARQLAAMKPSAVLVNVARGTLVDELALIEALERGTIAGAALDVAEREPLPPESPLWTLPNVFITPHTSAVSDKLWERQGDLLLDNLHRWFTGQPLRNRVDLGRGY
jgi:phosphoglycerate dehydrogenase-like enzyme